MEIRQLQKKDLSLLLSFFKSAYGNETIFSDLGYLEWFFSDKSSEISNFNHTGFIALDSGRIISHYGLLHSVFIKDQNKIPIKWMVSAYTLKEYRSQGLNTKIIQSIQNTYDTVGVISYPKEAIPFYENLGFSTLNGQNFDRYILNLDNRTFNIVKDINQDVTLAKEKLPINSSLTPSLNQNIIILDLNNYSNYRFEFSYAEEFTCFRDIYFYLNRFINHPFAKYTVKALIMDNKILGMVVSKIETLYPRMEKVNRIIDMFGNPEALTELLQNIRNFSIEEDLLYVDFSCFGSKFKTILIDCGFSILTGDEVSLLPQVTYPIENRPNLEFIALYSKKISKSYWNSENLYLTRADSDRDRLNKVSQLSI